MTAFTVVADTSGVLALIDKGASQHTAAHAAVDHVAAAGWILELVMTPLVLTELDYMVNQWGGGVDAELAFLDEVRRGTYTVAAWNDDDTASAIDVVKQYRDMNIGLADASNVVLASRYGTTTLFALDGHYRAIKPLTSGDAFRLLPADTDEVVNPT